jgi:hypothetical protein
MKLSRCCPRLALLLCMLAPACVYGDFSHPLDIDVNNTELGAKQGEASMQAVAWLVAWGDSGTAAAARQGGIKVIRHMDQHTFYVLFGLYYKNTTIVYGD